MSRQNVLKTVETVECMYSLYIPMDPASTVWLQFYSFEKLLFNTNGSNDFKSVEE